MFSTTQSRPAGRSSHSDVAIVLHLRRPAWPAADYSSSFYGGAVAFSSEIRPPEHEGLATRYPSIGQRLLLGGVGSLS